MFNETISDVTEAIHNVNPFPSLDDKITLTPKTVARPKKAYIFDLDATVIDSNHRVQPCMLPNGDLDLDKYIAEACTHDKIMGDTLLPLAHYMKALLKRGEKVIILTARHCGNSDYYFLRKNGLRTAVHLSRDQCARVFGDVKGHQVYHLGDAEYKRHYLHHLFRTMPDYDFCFFDDHNGVLSMAQENGVKAIDAKIMNDVLELQLADMYEQGYTDAESVTESLISDLLHSAFNSDFELA